MSKIIEFIINNIKELQPFDFILIFFFTLILCIGIFYTIRFIYKELIHAKSEVIKTKDELIATHRELTERVRNERDDLKSLLDEAQINLNSINEEYSRLQNNHEELKEQLEYRNTAMQAYQKKVNCALNVFFRTAVITAITTKYILMIKHTRAQIYLYEEYRISSKKQIPIAYEYLKQLDDVEEEFLTHIESVEELITIEDDKPKLPQEVPNKLLIIYNDSDTIKKYREIEKEIDTIIDPVMQDKI